MGFRCCGCGGYGYGGGFAGGFALIVVLFILSVLLVPLFVLICINNQKTQGVGIKLAPFLFIIFKNISEKYFFINLFLQRKN